MNQEVKAEWLRRLRDPNARQTTGALKRDVGFCCLGVLSDIAADAGIGNWSITGGKDWVFSSPAAEVDEEEGYSWSELTQQVADWAGLGETNPVVPITTPHRYLTAPSLAILNDDGLTFPQIADLIEAFL